MLYKAKRNSKNAVLAVGISASDVVIEVEDGSVLPQPPNIAVISDGEETETIYYSHKDGNTLSGVIRGYGGSVAKAWESGAEVRRNFTSTEWNELVDFIYGYEDASELVFYNDDGYVSSIEKHKNGIMVEKMEFNYNEDVLASVTITYKNEHGVDVYKILRTYVYADGLLERIEQEVL